MKSRSGSAEAAEAFPVVDLTPETIGDYGVCGYKDASRQVELRRKIAWFAVYHPKGLRIKVSEAHGTGVGQSRFPRAIARLADCALGRRAVESDQPSR